ncbi:MAG: helix-turn-helix domain-containing protein [Devosia sp.]
MTSIDTGRPEKTPVKRYEFSTDRFKAHEQFGAWSEFADAMCELDPDAPAKSGFRASVVSNELGPLLMTSFQLPHMNFKYTEEMLRKTKFDHWCISVIKAGAVALESPSSAFRVVEGEAVLHSYSTPFFGRMEGTSYCGLYFSRDDFWDLADVLDDSAHQQLRGPMSQIIGDFIVSLENRADQLTIAEAAAANQAFGSLLRAMVLGTPSTLEAAKAPIAAAQLDQARRFIRRNLRSPGLTPESICASLRVSRRQLSYLFKAQGGVATYIRKRRLAACYDALTTKGEKKLISSIAYEYGFNNLSSFTRQFQAQYGFPPSEARSAWLSGHRNSTVQGDNFMDWLSRENAG